MSMPHHVEGLKGRVIVLHVRVTQRFNQVWMDGGKPWLW